MPPKEPEASLWACRAARHWGQTASAALKTIYRGAILPILT
jgi:hypothetical protein